MYNTDNFVAVEVARLDGFDSPEPIYEKQEQGKWWARGYEREAIARRDRAFKYFDIRKWLRGE